VESQAEATTAAAGPAVVSQQHSSASPAAGSSLSAAKEGPSVTIAVILPAVSTASSTTNPLPAATPRSTPHASVREYSQSRPVSAALISADSEKVTTLSAALLDELEPETLACILQQLSSSSHLWRDGFQVVQHAEQTHPACFNFRTKPNTTTVTALPHTVDIAWRTVANIGRGTYGHALLMQTTGIDGERRVLKVDTDRDSVVWEAFMHMLVTTLIPLYTTPLEQLSSFQIQARLGNMTDSSVRAALQAASRRYIVAPTALLVYRSSAVLQLPYCPWGTLITALTALTKHRTAYSTQEHEALSAYISLQVLVPLM
jgi:hypothetical protein